MPMREDGPFGGRRAPQVSDSTFRRSPHPGVAPLPLSRPGPVTTHLVSSPLLVLSPPPSLFRHPLLVLPSPSTLSCHHHPRCTAITPHVVLPLPPTMFCHHHSRRTPLFFMTIFTFHNPNTSQNPLTLVAVRGRYPGHGRITRPQENTSHPDNRNRESK